MKKGCTGLQNIQLLRWCEELGIIVAWNLLAGFPGESASEYERMAELLPLLTHLQSPASCSPVRLDRFSPFYMRSSELGLVRLRPKPGYYYAYPLGRRDLARLAYFFDFDYADGRDPYSYLGDVQAEMLRWWNARTTEPEQLPRLDAFCNGDAVTIKDTRPAALQSEQELAGLAAQLYLRCDAAQSLANLQREFSDVAEGQEIRRTLEECIAAKLMIEMDGQYLSLAVMRNRSAPKPIEQQNVYSQIQQTPASNPLLHLA